MDYLNKVVEFFKSGCEENIDKSILKVKKVTEEIKNEIKNYWIVYNIGDDGINFCHGRYGICR